MSIIHKISYKVLTINIRAGCLIAQVKSFLRQLYAFKAPKPKEWSQDYLKNFCEFHPLFLGSASFVFLTCLKFFVLSFRGGQPFAGMDRSQRKNIKIFCLCDENGEKMVLENCL